MTNEFKKVYASGRSWRRIRALVPRRGKWGIGGAAVQGNGDKARVGWAGKGASGDGGRRAGDAIGETLRKALHGQGIKRQLRRVGEVYNYLFPAVGLRFLIQLSRSYSILCSKHHNTTSSTNTKHKQHTNPNHHHHNDLPRHLPPPTPPHNLHPLHPLIPQENFLPQKPLRYRLYHHNQHEVLANHTPLSSSLHTLPRDDQSSNPNLRPRSARVSKPA